MCELPMEILKSSRLNAYEVTLPPRASQNSARRSNN